MADAAPEPDRFDVARAPNEHIAFGHGLHMCLGAHLARMETAVLLDNLLQGCREIRIAGEPIRTRNATMRGVASLPLELVPA